MFRPGYIDALFSRRRARATINLSTLTWWMRVLLIVVACIVASTGMIAGTDHSASGTIGVVGLLTIVAGLVWYGTPQRRILLALLFLTAPFDVSKAFVAPLERFYSPGLYVTLAEALSVIVGIVWAIERVLVRRLSLPLTRLDAWAFGFMALVWIGAAHSQAGELAYASAASYSLCVVGFYVASHAVQGQREIRLALKMIFIGFCLQGIYVAAQMATQSFLTLPGAKVAPIGTQGLSYEAEQVTAFRPIGGFDHPNALADYLTLLLPPALGLVLMSRKRLPPAIWNAAAIVLVGGCGLLLLTLSRGGWVAATVGAAFVGIVYVRKRLIGTGHLVALVALVVTGVLTVIIAYPQVILRVTESDGRSVESRIVLTDQALTIIKAHPLIGVGFGGYNRAALEYIPPSFALISNDYKKALLQLIVHNHYLLLATELGLPAMVYWILLMLRFVRQAWPLAQWRDPALFALGVGLSGALASQMVFLASDNYYTDIRVFLLWLSAGLLQALTLHAKSAPSHAVAAARS